MHHHPDHVIYALKGGNVKCGKIIHKNQLQYETLEGKICIDCYTEKQPLQPQRQGLGAYLVERLIPHEFKIPGRLLTIDTEQKVVFAPNGKHEKTLDIPVAKIKWVKFTNEKNISAARVFFVGPVFGTAWKEKHNILQIDFEDEFGTIQHLAFEGHDDLENAEKELEEMRKTEEPLKVLKVRFAKGEITKEQYEEMKRIMGS